MSAAQAGKSRVEDLSARTESSSRYANPDGTWTIDAFAGPVRARSAKGDFAPVDPAAIQSGNKIKQRRGIYEARFSNGGDRELAQVKTTTGKYISVEADAPLPKPEVDGPELTYRNGVGGDDLVLRSFAEGFNFSVVIAERRQIGGEALEEPRAEVSPTPDPLPSPEPSLDTEESEQQEPELSTPTPSPSRHPSPSPAAPSTLPSPEEERESPGMSPVLLKQEKTTNGYRLADNAEQLPSDSSGSAPTPTFRFKLQSEGLTTSKSDDDVILFKDGSKVVAAMSKPVMWDSGKGEARRGGHIEVALANGSLSLRPDPTFLADPNTQYPVTVDPSIVLNVASDTWVHSLLDTSSQIDSPELRVGGYSLGLDKARSYLNFDLSALPAGIAVSEAKVNLNNFYTGSCAGTALTMTRITGSWSPGSITWGTQPAVTTSGQSSSSTAFGSAACSGEGTVQFDARQIVADWAGGAANLGVRIQADNETASSGARKFRSMENGDASKVPTLSLTYNAPPTIPSSLEVDPALTDGAGLLTSASKPTFAAIAADPDGSLVTPEFQLSRGGTIVDSATLAPVSSGSRVSRKPSAALTAGTYEARWRVSDGALTSAWSSPVSVTVDLTPPSEPSIACTGVTQGSWYETAPASSTTCTATVDGSTSSVSAVLNGADIDFPDPSGGSTAKTFSLPTSGMFELEVTAYDKASNSSTKRFRFGTGSGALTSPVAGLRSANRFSVKASSKGGASTAKLQWRVAGSSTWTDATQVAQDGSPWTGQVSQLGQISDTGAVAWAAGEETGAETPSLIEARACFSYSSAPTRCTANTSLSLVPHAFGGSFPVHPIGPALVALQTGEFQVSAQDVDVASIGLGRTYTSFDGPTSPAQSVFGPGWSAGLQDANPGLSEATVVDDTATSGTITLIVGGESWIYRHESGATGAQATGIYLGQGETAALNQRLELLAGSPKTLVLVDQAGTKTQWSHVSGSIWTIKKTEDSSTTPGTNYVHDGAGLVTGVYDAPSGVACDQTAQARGCRALILSYVTVGGSKRLDKVEAKLWDPQPGTDGSPGTGQMSTTTVARYSYDSSGRLISMWDPRLTGASGPLETTYTYQSVGGETYLESITAPGQKAWTFHVGANGALETVTRAQDSSIGGTATWTVAYDVPLSGAGLPDLTASGSAKWGQPTAPVSGAAVFEPGTSTSDWRDADLYFFTRAGVVTNTAEYGSGQWLVESQDFDAKGNLYWDLDARARAMCLSAGFTASAVARLCSTYSTFNATGTRIETVREPLQYVVLDSGTAGGNYPLTEYVYDDEAAAEGVPVPGRPAADPNKPSPNVVVEERRSVGISRTDMVKTRYRYDKVSSSDGDGWELATPSRVSQQLGAGWSTTLTRLDASGRIIEVRSPQGVAISDGPGSDAYSMLTAYYTSDSSSPSPSCRNRPEWVDIVCRVSPGGGSIPTESSAGFDRWLNPTRVVESSGSMSRTSVTTNDVAGRPTKTEVVMAGAPSGDQPIPDATYSYSETTGEQLTTVAGGSVMATTWDTWGRMTSQTDGTGTTATYTYDAADRVKSVFDGKGTYTYTYDGTDARGEQENRGLVTKLDVDLPSGPDVISSAYGVGGEEIERHWPGGVVTTSAYDVGGRKTGIVHARDGVPLAGEIAVYDRDGRVRKSQTTGTAQTYTYDARGRLTTVQDKAFFGVCTTRTYEFSLDSNRTKLETAGPASNGDCQAANPTTKLASFDTESKVIDSGYTYDSFGRTRTLPAADTDSPSGGNVSVNFHANDMVAKLTRGTQTKTYALDAAGRISNVKTATGGVNLTESTSHYSGTDDSPSWVESKRRPDGSSGWTTSWSRYVTGPDGGLAIQLDSDLSARIQLPDLHGDILATVATQNAGNGLANYQEFTEYGIDHETHPGSTEPYGYLGVQQRSSDSVGGLTLMGARLYNATSGRFLTRDPVFGGNDNAYVYPPDPVNMSDTSGECAKCVYEIIKYILKRYVKPATAKTVRSMVNLVKSAWRAAVASSGAAYATLKSKGFEKAFGTWKIKIELEKQDHKFGSPWDQIGLGGWRKHLRITAWRPKHKGSHFGFQIPYGCEYPHRMAKHCK